MTKRLLAVLVSAAALLACGVAEDIPLAHGTESSCTSCHGDPARAGGGLLQAAPPASTQGGSGGAHLAHLERAVACDACHVVPSSSQHSSGTVDVSFSGLAAAKGAAPGFSGGAGGTCSGVYCHGATLGAGGQVAAPSWSSGPLACDACHGSPPPSHAAGSTSCSACHPGTVKPDGTIDLAGGLHVNGVVESNAGQGACGTCHGIPPAPPHSTSTACGGCHTGYTSSTVNDALHRNGTVDAISAHPAGWLAKDQHGYTVNRSGLGTCKSCHGANLDGVGGTARSCTACHASVGFASWATSCTFCHGDRTTGRASPPVDTQGGSAATKVSVGVHASHLATTLMAAPACTACHPDRTGSNVITDGAHVDGNGVPEIAFGNLARTGGAAAVYTRTSATAASCASVYCHGAFSGGANATVQWTSTTQVSCTSCHGLPPSTGRHGKHSGRSCGDCHPGYTRTTADQATHLNGTKQVGNKVTSWNAGTRSCSTSCHGNETW